MGIADYLNRNDQFAAGAGCRIVEMGEGYAKAVMTVGKRHLNAGGVCQGGAYFTLADLAMAAVMNSGGQLTFSVETNIAFLRSAREGDVLTALARLKADHHKLPLLQVEITDATGTLLCVVTSLAYRKSQRVPDGE